MTYFLLHIYASIVNGSWLDYYNLYGMAIREEWEDVLHADDSVTSYFIVFDDMTFVGDAVVNGYLSSQKAEAAHT